jgi:PhnB protein
MAVKAIPEGYEGSIPYLSCKDATRAIEFYKKAFGATELMRMPAPEGKIGHAEIQIGAAKIMLADEFPEMGFMSPLSLGGSPVGIHIYVEDVDALTSKASAAGAKIDRPVADQFYGDRSVTLSDPFGHRWFFATHKEDLSQEEMRQRGDALMKQHGEAP